MRKYINPLLLAFVFIALAFSSCKQTTEPTTSANTQSSEDNALIDGEFSAIFSMASSQGDVTNSTEAEKKANGIAGEKDKSDLLPSCATVTIDSIAKEILIDFGSQNCLCKDGLYRRGKVKMKLTGVWKNIGSSFSITLIDYYVQDMKVTGTKTVTILTSTSFLVMVDNATMVTPKGTLSWASNHTIKQIKGFGTKNTTMDDEFEILGGSSGTNSEGVFYTVTIDSLNPLIKRISCKQKDFVAGILTIQNDKGKTLVVNYDPQNAKGCNKNATCTVNGKTYNMKLR